MYSLKYNSLITNYIFKKISKNVFYINFNFEVEIWFDHLWQFDIDLTGNGLIFWAILGHFV